MLNITPPPPKKKKPWDSVEECDRAGEAT
jgi:hypothetical protein